MFGSKTLFALVLTASAVLAASMNETALHQASSSNTTQPVVPLPTKTDDRVEGFDKAVEKLAAFFHVFEPTVTETEKESFEKSVEQLAIAYNVPLVAPPTETESATNATRFASIVKERASVIEDRLSKCTLSATAEDTRRLKLDCASNKIRFVGIGDWGEKSATAAINAVRDGILAENGNLDFVLNAGDSFYTMGVTSTTDAQWTNSWYKRYAIGTKLTVPWFSVLGNHDHYGNANAQIAFSKSTQPGAKFWILPDAFYTVDVTGASGKTFKMVFTDTNTFAANNLEWVESQVQDAASDFVLAVGHHHIYSQGGRGDNSDKNMKKLNAIWRGSLKVKAYICGHEHDMQLLRANNIDYSLIGGGGRGIDFGDKSPGTKAEKVYYARNYGYAVYEVDMAARTITTTYYVYNKSGTKIDTKSFTRTY